VLTLAAAPTDACIAAVGDAHEATSVHSLAGICLLVVEDDAVARELLARELGARGAMLHSVPEALSALLVVQQQRFDAALIDWDLPGMHGVDLARTLRTQQPLLPLIAVTGRVTPADQALAIEAGFVAHVAKPVDPDRLVATLIEVLER
jgi:CheY-like chemotaxis protein